MTKKMKKNIGGRVALDIAVVLLILAAVTGIVVRIVLNYPSRNTENQNTSVTLHIDKIYNSALDSIKTGDKLYLTSDGTFIGRITLIEHDPETEEEKPYPYITGATIELNPGKGAVVEGSCKIGDGLWLTPNGELAVCTDSVEFSATVISISEN